MVGTYFFSLESDSRVWNVDEKTSGVGNVWGIGSLGERMEYRPGIGQECWGPTVGPLENAGRELVAGSLGGGGMGEIQTALQIHLQTHLQK